MVDRGTADEALALVFEFFRGKANPAAVFNEFDPRAILAKVVLKSACSTDQCWLVTLTARSLQHIQGLYAIEDEARTMSSQTDRPFAWKRRYRRWRHFTTSSRTAESRRRLMAVPPKPSTTASNAGMPWHAMRSAVICPSTIRPWNEPFDRLRLDRQNAGAAGVISRDCDWIVCRKSRAAQSSV